MASTIMKLDGAQKGQSFWLKPSQINTAYFPDVRSNSRTKDAIQEKKKSILKLGQLAPIGIALTPEGEPAVKFGRTRLAALAEIEQAGGDLTGTALAETGALVRCELVENEFDDLKAMVVALAENTASTPMYGLEIGNKIKALEDGGYKLKDIAETVGLSQSQVRIYRDLVTEAAPEIQKLVSQGKISPSTVQKLVAKDADGTKLTHEEQVAAIQPLLEAEQALTRGAVQDVADEAKKKKSGSTGPSGAKNGTQLDTFFLAIADTEDPETSKHGKAVAEAVVKFAKDFVKFRQGLMSSQAFSNRLFALAAGPKAKEK